MKKKELKKLFDVCPFCGGKMNFDVRKFWNDCGSKNPDCIFQADMDQDGNFVRAEFKDQVFLSVEEVLRFVKLRAFE